MNNRLSFTLVVVCVLSWFLGSAQAAEIDARFDHFTTGFPLSGQHVRTACEACHVKGVFKGTPQQCGGCHNGAIAPGKHARHIVSTNTCDDCHTTFAWTGARMDHSTVTSTCRTCHNNSQAPGMPAWHFHITADCSECHGTLAWSPARYDHSNTSFTLTGKHLGRDCDVCHGNHRYKGTPMLCSGCHKKNARHFVSSNTCDDCHNTRTWKGAKGFHNNITGRCDVCHGKTATGKPTKHIATSGDCVDCHTTVSWHGATGYHNNITGRCDACHGKTATGKPNVHPSTTDDCNACHLNTTTFSGAKFDHSNITVSCDVCHSAAFASAVPKKSHIKTEVPSLILYTLDVLKNCTNTACHIYSDNSFTTITTRRDSHHTVGGSW